MSSSLTARTSSYRDDQEGDRAGRSGIRVGDPKNLDFFEMRFPELAAAHMRAFPGLEIDLEGRLAYRSVADRVSAMATDTVEYANDASDTGKRGLIEGAGATMLGIDGCGSPSVIELERGGIIRRPPPPPASAGKEELRRTRDRVGPGSSSPLSTLKPPPAPAR